LRSSSGKKSERAEREYRDASSTKPKPIAESAMQGAGFCRAETDPEEKGPDLADLDVEIAWWSR